MAKTIVLSLNHFEPYHVEVVQCSVGDTITFIFRDYAGSHDDPSLHLKSPSGIPEEIACIATTGFIGAEFTPNADTFLEPGRYTGTLEFGDTDDPDVIVYSFPIFFDVIRSASIYRWSRKIQAEPLDASADYTIATPSVFSPYGTKIFAKLGGGCYTITDGSYDCMPDPSTGPIKIEYDSSNTGAEITVTNIGSYPYMIPEVEFYAFTDAPTGFQDMTEDPVELVFVSMEGDPRPGLNDVLPVGESITMPALPRDPDVDIEILKRLGYQDPQTTVCTVPKNGNEAILSNEHLKVRYNPKTRIVTLTGYGVPSGAVIGSQLQAVSGYYVEA